MARKKQQQGIQSVEIGMRVLKALAAMPSDASLKSIAAASGMSASTVHRYLVSLGRAGLVEQDAVSGHYGLGIEALEIGLVALGRIDAVKIGTAALTQLRSEVDVSALLAVWGTHGATIIRFVEASQPVTVNVHLGDRQSLPRLAAGCAGEEARGGGTGAAREAEAAGDRRRCDPPRGAQARSRARRGSSDGGNFRIGGADSRA
jgi:DNA-binding transcriptional ArsR family regulator